MYGIIEAELLSSFSDIATEDAKISEPLLNLIPQFLQSPSYSHVFPAKVSLLAVCNQIRRLQSN